MKQQQNFWPALKMGTCSSQYKIIKLLSGDEMDWSQRILGI